jgi:protein-S-isoprenylcysteine O-methyltransferase Ste14
MRHPELVRRLARRVLFLALFVWLAVTIGLVRFWILGAILIAFVVYTTSAVDRTLMKERFRPAGPTADRGLLIVIRLSAAAQLIVSLLDIGRFHWSDTVPASLRAAGMIAVAVSLALLSRAMTTNRFFSSAIRVQSDRGHQVVRDGPYAIVRHPGYLGMIVFVPAEALALGSWYGLLLALIYSATIARRVSVEDGYLRGRLDGYVEYANDVRYRLVPGVW